MAAISVDRPDASRNLRAKRGYTYTFLSDPDTAVIKRYDLLHPKAGPDEQDVARPAEFLLDPSGTVRWVISPRTTGFAPPPANCCKPPAPFAE